MKVTKKITFCAAHRLLNYDGPCQNIHGHNYTVEATVEGAAVHNDMVVDFNEVKENLVKLVHNVYDHSIMVNDADESLKTFVIIEDMKHVFLDGNATAENMARAIFHALYQTELSLENIRVWETDTSYADFSVENYAQWVHITGRMS